MARYTLTKENRTRGLKMPLLAILTRLSPRELDSDNLQGALKAVRDGVADAFGVDDRDPGIAWEYRQENAKSQMVRIELIERSVNSC